MNLACAASAFGSRAARAEGFTRAVLGRLSNWPLSWFCKFFGSITTVFHVETHASSLHQFDKLATANRGHGFATRELKAAKSEWTRGAAAGTRTRDCVQTGSKDKNLLQIGRGRRLLADRDEAAGCGGFGETAGLSQGDAEDRTRREALEVQ